MKGLSLWQPWATLIAIGEKRIETRSWGTAYRGELLICATASTPAEGWSVLGDPGFFKVLPKAGYPNRISFPQGGALALAYLADVRQIASAGQWGYSYRRNGDKVHQPWETLFDYEFGNYGEGRYAWHLADIRPLPNPYKCRGGQGLWMVPQETQRAVYQALNMTAEEIEVFGADPDKPAIGSLFESMEAIP
ncbi:MAG: ASCH domain-containing protein [Armatimonadota bacterium]